VNTRLRAGDAEFGEEEGARMLGELDRVNKVMVSGGVVYRL
jgi:hypothetical protein